MPFDLLHVVRAESKSELARRIRAKWVQLAPRDRVPEAVAISNRLGDLERDRSAWWESDNRRSARRAFEQVTGLSLRDLPLARDVILSPDFPRLRPFRPHDESPLSLAMVNWFAVPERTDRRWIVAPPGAGRSFAVQWHHLHGAARATEVPRLMDASDLLAADTPIVIGVEAPDVDSDEGVLARLADRAAVLVIAPFSPRERSQDESSAHHGERNVYGESVGPPDAAFHWSVEKWQPAPAWREKFVNWIAGRIDDRETLLDAHQLVSWLERIDPSCETFATPGDVVALCAFAHESGVPSFHRDLADRFLRARLDQEAAHAREGGTWLRACGVDVVRALTESRLSRVDLPLWGQLDRSCWTTLVPADVARRSLEEPEVDELLDRKRMSKKEARTRLLRRSAPEIVELLISSRVLRAQGDGVSLHPRWVVFAFARARIHREVMEGMPSTWGRWAVDAERRELVNAVLDNLAIDVLVRLSDRAVAAFDKTSLGSVGAIEALFAALGRRLGPRVHAPNELHALWEVQRSLLIARHWNLGPLAPRTRPGFESRGDWVACCWAWSLYGPTARIDDSEAWLFPGWCEQLSLEHMTSLERINLGEPGWTGREPPFELDRSHQLGGAFGRLLEMAFELVPRCQDPSLPEHLPAVLVPAIMFAAHRRRQPWIPTAKHIRELTGSRWGSAFLVERASALPDDERVEISRTIWSALLGEQRGAVYALDYLRQSMLLDFVADHLAAADFAKSLSPTDASGLRRLLELPPAFRLPLVRHALSNFPDQVKLLDIGLEHVGLRGRGSGAAGVQDAPWIELLADACHPSWPYRQALWRVAPERALTRTLSADFTDRAAADWFQVAPQRFHPKLLDHLAKSPRPLPDWAVLWLRHRVLEGGAEADRAHALTEQW